MLIRLPPSASEMVIPGHAVGKVMGKGGANVDNIRKVIFIPSFYFCFTIYIVKEINYY